MSEHDVPVRRRPTTWLALGLLALGLGSPLLGAMATISYAGSSEVEEFGLRGALFGAISAVTFASVGTFVAIRLPSNVIGWLLLLIGVGFGLLFTGAMAFSMYDGPDATPTNRVLTIVGLSAWYLIFTTLVPRLLLVFPDGRLPGPRWRYVALAAVVATASPVLFRAIATSPDYGRRLPNPLAVVGMPEEAVRFVSVASMVSFMAVVALAGLSVLLRYRRSVGLERQQTKWFMGAVALLFPAAVVAAITGSESGWLLMLATVGLLPGVDAVTFLGRSTQRMRRMQPSPRVAPDPTPRPRASSRALHPMTEAIMWALAPAAFGERLWLRGPRGGV